MWLVELVLATEDVAVGEAEVELCRQSEGVKNEDGVEAGLVSWRTGKPMVGQWVVLGVVCGDGCKARDDKLRRVVEPSDLDDFGAAEMISWTLRRGSAVGRSPSCTVTPNIALRINGLRCCCSRNINTKLSSKVHKAWHALVSMPGQCGKVRCVGVGDCKYKIRIKLASVQF